MYRYTMTLRKYVHPKYRVIVTVQAWNGLKSLETACTDAKQTWSRDSRAVYVVGTPMVNAVPSIRPSEAYVRRYV